ncbi:heparinase II/III domain-containing protein [Actinomadura formosensis]|uniref:heparinase II/III domain-containing protein n=1 Tax=Actinomadura formosensis TaxID=60706 RepID=UPI0009FCD431|nr:heparinase II/III family protein [Actinomadura formosensis]
MRVRAGDGRHAGWVLLLMLAACSGPAHPGEPSKTGVVAAAATPRTPQGTCLGYNGLDGLNPAAQVRAGRFRTPDGAPVRVARGTDVDWNLNPYHDRSWQLWFHSLEWLGGSVREYERTGDRAALATATGIAQDWLADNRGPGRFGRGRQDAIAESVKFRLITLVCLRRHLAAPWLDEAIARHAEWLARPENYAGPWNHGTDESMTLMSAGCATGRTDLADLGRRRLLDAVFHPPGGAPPAIDAQGASTEQSTGYSVYNRSRWGLVMKVMRNCRRPVPAELVRRHRLMDEFIAFQVTPGGDLLQIGESHAAKASAIGRLGSGPLRYAATLGREGTPPGERVKIYDAGYVMGRSGWGTRDRPYTQEMAYTARFGPGRYVHGQSDHMALTFYALGRSLLVPSGHIGYNDPAWRAWLQSPEAHNTLVVRDAPFRAGAATALTGHRFRRGADTFRFSDTAFTGTRRTRSVLAAAGPDALVVLDEARSRRTRTVDQLWHLPADFSAAADGAGAVATAGDVRVRFLRIPLPGTASEPARVVRGSRTPRQGWIAPSHRTRVAAPVVSLPARGRRTRILTLIAPVRDAAPPQPLITIRRDGGVRVDTAFAGRRLVVEAAADGTLRRLG